MLATSFLFGAPAHGGVFGQGQFVDPAGLFGPDQEHAQHPHGFLDGGLGALLAAGEFQKRVGAEELAYVGGQDAFELPVGPEEGFDLLEVLAVGIDRALLLALAFQVFEVGLASLVQCVGHDVTLLFGGLKWLIYKRLCARHHGRFVSIGSQGHTRGRGGIS